MSRPEREARVRALIAARGAKIYPKGKAWRIVGPGVDVTVADLGLVRAEDFQRNDIDAGGRRAGER